MAGQSGIRAGRSYVEMGLRDRMSAGLDRASAKLRGFSRNVAMIGASIMAGGGAMLAPLMGAVNQFANVGDTLDKTSKRTGMTVEALSELGFAAEQSGAEMGTLEKGVKGMQRSVNDLSRGLSTQKDAFGDLGLTMKDLEGKIPEDQFSLIADRISEIEDPGKRAALAMQIFGRAGQQLLPMLNGGAAGIDALRKQARDLGLTVSGDAATSAAELTDRMNEMWRVAKRGVFEIGGALAPTVIDLTKRVTELSVTALGWVKENKHIVVWVAKVAVGVVAVGAALMALAGAGMALSFVLAGLSTVIGVAGTVLGAILSPIGLAVAAVVGLGVALYKAWQSGALDGLIASMKQFAKGAWEAVQRFGEWSGITTILKAIWGPLRDLGSYLGGKLVGLIKDLGGIFTKTFQGVRDAIATGNWEAAGEIVMAGLEAAWLSGVATLSSIWNDFKTGMVEAFAGAVVAIHKLWTDMQNRISKTLIEWTSRDDVVGKAARVVTGFDPREMKQANERKSRSGAAFKLEEWERMLQEAMAAGDDQKVKELKGWISAEKRKQAAGDFGVDADWDPTADVMKVLDEMTAQEQEKTGEWAADLTRRAREAAQRVKDARRQEADGSREQLDDLAGQASDDRTAQEGLDKLKEWGQYLAGLGGELLDNIAGWGEKVEFGEAGEAFGTFSADAAARISGGESIEDRQLQTQREIAKNTKAIAAKPALAFGR